MLQRNPHPYALDVPAIPATVQPGDTVDWPDPIAGFEAVPDGPVPEVEAASAKTSKSTVKRTADQADSKEA